MKKIYLASVSPARKKLLEGLGVKFEVVVTNIKEQSAAGMKSYAGTVRHNARLKARAAADKVDSAVIIAADTIVVCGKRVFGKPKDMRDAHRMLKYLSGKPQWVYTGLAVLDNTTGKIKVGCEKSKVYMTPLSDKEIKDYFLRVSPLDKAGGFDIQGRGAIFIKRIEGCFYNVVGLPLARLQRMLKEFGVDLVKLSCVILSLAGVFALCGCTTEYNIATGKEDVFFYSTAKEAQMGRSISQQVEKEYKFVDDPLVQKRVEDIGKSLALVSDRKELDYYFKVIEDDEINAVSLPGGYVYVFKGVLDTAGNDDELACVIGHEIGHIVSRHSIKKLQAYQGYSILRALIGQVPQVAASGAANAADVAFLEILLGYGREDELQADKLGSRYAKLAGYNPRAMIDFLEKMREKNKRMPARPYSYFKTHPYVPDRIRVVKQEIGEKIDFADYINTEDKPHR